MFIENIFERVILETYDCFYSFKHYDHTFELQGSLFGTLFIAG